MKNQGVKNPRANLATLGLKNLGTAYWNLPISELIEHTIQLNEGVLTDTGALMIRTGEFTGRSPRDRFIVEDEITADTVDWGDVNTPFASDKFDHLYDKVVAYLGGKNVYIRDAYACANDDYRLPLRLIAEKPWSAMFAYNMFLRPSKVELENANPEWHILCVPGFMANAEVDGTRQHNFAILNFTRKTILIGGTGYTGEIKKGIFSVLNYTLPEQKGILPMHCSANVGKAKDTAVFFGLSGTGKTTLSADPQRNLIGDDEHGWADDGIFNFEGGCYAKTIDLSPEKEPQIWSAIKYGAILENIIFQEGTRTPDYTRADITQNTRVSYPIHHIDNALQPSRGGIPKNIFFLTCDAFGVLPPIARLTVGQAMYHFISGYTAKVAGTEAGINEPQCAFSACFGAPFLPLHPTQYAEMLGKRMRKDNVNIWLVNTGWSGGAYGVGERMSLTYTRAMITAALNGELDNVAYKKMAIFGLNMPTVCPNVPDAILDPRNTWADKNAYDHKARILANDFVRNFDQYKTQANKEILSAAPTTTVEL